MNNKVRISRWNKNRLGRQWVSCMLVLALVLGVVPGLPLCTVVAAPEGQVRQPDTSWYVKDEADATAVYYISTAEQLAGLASLVNHEDSNERVDFSGKSIRLTGDIDLDQYDWEPIGRSDQRPFRGVFSGQGHTIRNLKIEITGEDNADAYIGLFGYIASASSEKMAKIENTVLLDVDISVDDDDGTYYIGGLCGYNNEGRISGCAVSNGDITGSVLGAVGGIVGYNTGVVIYCFNENVSMAGAQSSPNGSSGSIVGGVGGICGLSVGGSSGSSAAAGISLCYNTGTVVATNKYVGGICGGIDQVSTIERCYNAENVSLHVNTTASVYNIGGVCGYKSNNTESRIMNSYWIKEKGLALYVDSEETTVAQRAVGDASDSTINKVESVDADTLKDIATGTDAFNSPNNWDYIENTNQNYPILTHFYQPPEFTQDPLDEQNAPIKSDIVFFTSVTSFHPVTYRWQYATSANPNNWVDITESDKYANYQTDTLTVKAVTTGENGYKYRCIANNGINKGGSADVPSKAATLTIDTTHKAPEITTQPTNQTVMKGSPATFLIKANGNPLLTYQWQVSDNGIWQDITDGAIYTGAKSDTLNVASVTIDLNGSTYRCQVTNGVEPSCTSNVVTLNIDGYGISLNPSGSYTFDAASAGYIGPPTLTVTVSNTGINETGALSVALSGNGNSSFELVSDTIASIVADDSATFIVKPKEKLPVGQYTETVTVSGGNQIEAKVDIHFTVNKSLRAINIKEIGGITHPVSGGTPVTAITETDQFTGTVAWSPDDNPFAYNKVYTATITLTPKETDTTIYTLTDVEADYFEVDGAATVTNEANSDVITATFPVTDQEAVESFTIKTPPTKTGYVADELLDLTGLVVSLEKNIGVIDDVAFTDFAANNITTDPENGTVLSESDTNVTITYTPGNISVEQAITVVPLMDPTITKQPEDHVAIPGDKVEFSIVAEGNPPPTYQWQILTADIWQDITDGAIYTGAKSDTLSIASVTIDQNDSMYRCQVENNGEPIFSDAATLTVYTSAITLSPSVDKDFLICYVGYTTPSPHEVTVTNTGNEATGDLTIALTGADADAFVLSATAIDSLNKGENETFAVAPIAALPKGLYEATVTVSGVGVMAQSFAVSFTVEDLSVEPVSIKQISGVTPPVPGQPPVDAIAETAEYTGTVTWSPPPVDNKFAYGTAYTATITLTPKTVLDTTYTFAGVTADFFTVTGADTVTNAADSGVITATFPTTDLELVKAITIKTPPNRVEYLAGEILELTGLVVSLERISGLMDDVAFSAFEANYITTDPVSKKLLSESDTAVTITYTPDNKSVVQTITVNPQPVTVTAFDIKKPPTKTNYMADDVLDLTGLVVTVTRSDGSSEDVVFADFAGKGITTNPKNGALLKATHTAVTITIAPDNTSVKQAITVQPLPGTVTSVTIKTPPNKTAYIIGEALDLTGLVVALNKSDDTSEEVVFADFAENGITTVPANGTTLTEADTVLTVMYQSDKYTATQAITVNPPPIIVTALTIQTPPTRTDYTAGETLDLTGLVVTLTKSDDSSVDVALADFAANNIVTIPANGAVLSSDHTDVTITHVPDEQSVSQPITVEPTPVTVISFTIRNKPDKTTYQSQNTLDLSGLVVRMIKSDESFEDVAFEDFVASGITTNPANGAILTHNDTFVTIYCENGAVSVKQSITVSRSTINEVTVGAQQGTLTAGNSGSVTFPVTTTNKPDGTYFISVTNLPTGFSTNGQLLLKNNSGTLTLSGNAFIAAGTTSNLTLVLDGVSSNAFTLTVTGSGGTADTDTGTYRLTLRARTGGSIIRGVSGQYDEGELVSIEAEMEDGYVFDRWESSNGGEFNDEYDAMTTFTMPANDTTVTAYFYYDVYSAAQQSAYIPPPITIPSAPTPTPAPQPSTGTWQNETDADLLTPSVGDGNTANTANTNNGNGVGGDVASQGAASGKINALVNGKPLTFDNQPPTAASNTRYVPVRDIFDALGYSVRWSQATQTATFYNGIYTVNIRVGASSFTTVLYAKTTIHTINPPVLLVNGKMMIALESLRTLQLSIGNNVAWDNNQNNLTITSGFGFTMLPTP